MLINVFPPLIGKYHNFHMPLNKIHSLILEGKMKKKGYFLANIGKYNIFAEKTQAAVV